MSNNTKLENGNKYNESFFVNIAFVLLAFALFTTFILIIFKEQFNLYFDFTELASLGSFLGGIITAFLTFSTILLVFATYKTQQKELAATREQLEETVRQAEITNKTMLKQQFETTFFNMINMHNNLVEGLTLYNKEIKGRDVFISLFDLIENYYKKDQMDFYLKARIRSCETLGHLEAFIENYYECMNMRDSKKEYNFEKFNINKELPKIWNDLRNYDGAIEMNIGNILKLNFDDFKLIIDINKFDGHYGREIINNNELLNSIELSFIESKHFKQTSYLTVCSDFRDPLSSYYKSIHGIIHFVESAKLNVDEKTKYLEMFSSLFGTFEITLLHYEIHLGENEQLKDDLAFVPSLGLSYGYLDIIL